MHHQPHLVDCGFKVFGRQFHRFDCVHQVGLRDFDIDGADVLQETTV